MPQAVAARRELFLLAKSPSPKQSRTSSRCTDETSSSERGSERGKFWCPICADACPDLDPFAMPLLTIRPSKRPKKSSNPIKMKPAGLPMPCPILCVLCTIDSIVPATQLHRKESPSTLTRQWPPVHHPSLSVPFPPNGQQIAILHKHPSPAQSQSQYPRKEMRDELICRSVDRDRIRAASSMAG